MVDSYFNKKSRKEINPDEVVSLGSVVYGSHVRKSSQGSLKHRVRFYVPLSLGVEVEGG
jgi:molecular chaperone DnaK (HSP70)